MCIVVLRGRRSRGGCAYVVGHIDRVLVVYGLGVDQVGDVGLGRF
jgi:hypothetical protein